MKTPLAHNEVHPYKGGYEMNMRTTDDDGITPGFWGCVFIAMFSTLMLMTVWALIKHGAFHEVFTSWGNWILAIVVSLPAPVGLALRNRFASKRRIHR